MLSIILLSVLLTTVTADYVSYLVNTTEGQVQGAWADDGAYYAFYGIRYGADTSGVNRFKAPSPPPLHQGVFNAIERNILCPQPSLNNPETIIGEEDCLRLSIFTPSNSIGNPVIVWLAGEEYTTSNPLQYSFRRLVYERVTVVALNYRLSVLGFMCLGIEEAPGNAGLKDVVQGLKWIKNNIQGFGGDPNNIILLGHGSGAAMVDLTSMSPLTEGLVHKVIVQSGSALAPWAVSYSPVASAERLAIELGYDETSNDNQTLVQTLISATTRELILPIVNNIQYRKNVILFAPCVENDKLEPDNRFLTDAPFNLLVQGRFSEIPYIASYANKEGSVRVGDAVEGNWLQRMDNEFEQFFPIDLNLSDNNKSSIRSYYFGETTINMDQIEDYIEYHGDTLTMMSVIRGVTLRAASSTLYNIRLLEFSYDAIGDSERQFPEFPALGARHGEILKYLFDVNDNNIECTERIIKVLLERYINFARTRIPNVINASLGNVLWDPVMPGHVNTLCITGGRSRISNEMVGGRVRPSNEISSTNVTIVRCGGQESCWDNQRIKRAFWDPIYSGHYIVPPMVGSAPEKVNFTSFFLLLHLIIGVFSCCH